MGQLDHTIPHAWEWMDQKLKDMWGKVKYLETTLIKKNI